MAGGRVTRESLERLRAHINVQDYLSAFVELKRSGGHLAGRCPFHADSTPSFHVFADHYHCFGCQAHGDAIDYEMFKSGRSFAEAVETLADKYRVQLEYENGNRKDDAAYAERKRLLHILDEVAQYYHRQLLSKEGDAARQYLSSRRFDLKEVKDWKLGLSLPQFPIHELAIARGWALEDLQKLDLVRIDDRKRPYDFFRQRIMIPVRDEKGQTIAFGGRAYVGEVKSHKYLNSATSDLFQKSHVLFNLDRARSSIVQQKEAIVVEGYMDCMALANAGVENVVAVLGTALTEEHVKKLERLTKNVTLCFDSDAAGKNALLKSFQLAYPLNLVNLNSIAVPSGKDPDEFLKTSGVDAFRRLLATQDSLTLRAAEILSEKIPGKEAKVRALKSELIPVILKHPDAGMREVSLDILAQAFGLSSGRALVSGLSKQKTGASASTSSSGPQASKSGNAAAEVSPDPEKSAETPLQWPVYSTEELRFVLSLLFVKPTTLPDRLYAVSMQVQSADELDRKGVERLLGSGYLSAETALLCEEIFSFWRATRGETLVQSGFKESIWPELSPLLQALLALSKNDFESLERVGLAVEAIRAGASKRNQGLLQFGNVFVPANIPYLRFLLKDLEISKENMLSQSVNALLLKLEMGFLDRDLQLLSEKIRSTEVLETGNDAALEERRRRLAAERMRRWEKFHG